MDDTDTLLDYCAGCERHCGCSRMDTLTNPHTIHWDGGRGIVAFYECPDGHVWRCWWDALRWLDDA